MWSACFYIRFLLWNSSPFWERLEDRGFSKDLAILHMDAILQGFSEDVIHMKRQIHNPVDLYRFSSVLWSGNNEVFSSCSMAVDFETVRGTQVPINGSKTGKIILNKISWNINEHRNQMYYILEVLFN